MNKSTKIFLIIIGVLFSFTFFIMFFFWMLIRGGESEDEVVFKGSGDKIAEVDLTGEIISSESIVRQFKKYRDDHSIKAIVFRIDSPGGGVAASQEIYEEVKKTRDDGTIVVVSMGSLGASGGYYVACGANKIVANRGTLTGSIGVISQFMQYDTLLKKIGVTVTTIKSGKLKDAGNPFRTMSESDKEYFQSLMDDVHKQFKHVVETERKLDADTVAKYADGRVFTGEQALDLGLIDKVGTFQDAVSLAAKLADIKGKPSIVKEIRRRRTLFDFFFNDDTESKFSEIFELKDHFINRPILQYKMPQVF